MNLIDRYLNALGNYLPDTRRVEIMRELRANLMDKVDALAAEQGRALEDEEISTLLKSMGHPQQVAVSYLPPQYLVAPALFPFYKQVLSYGVLGMFTLELLKVMGAFFAAGNFNLMGMAFSLVFGFGSSALIMFASVTGVFYALSNSAKGRPLYNPHKTWRPEALPPVTQTWQQIKLAEQSGEFAMSLFLMLLLHYPVVMSDAAIAQLLVGFADPVKHWVPWLAAVVGLSMIFNLWNLRFSFWTRRKLMLNACLSLATAILLIGMSRLPAILVELPGHETPAFSMLWVNHIMSGGMLITAIWLIYECLRDLYRFWLLRAEVVC